MWFCKVCEVGFCWFLWHLLCVGLLDLAVSECANVCLCEWVCICLSGECSQTGDVGEYSIKLIPNTFPACLCLCSRIRPVKARGPSDEALPLWCMPPWFSPVLDRWCTTTGGQRTSQCSPDVAVCTVESWEHASFYHWVRGVVESRLWYYSLSVLDWRSLEIALFPLQQQHLHQFFQVCQAVTCCGQNFPSGGLDSPLSIKKHLRTSLQMLPL